jgi:hypothetical protein
MLSSSTTCRIWAGEIIDPSAICGLGVEARAADGTGKPVCVRGGAFGGMKGVLLQRPLHRPALVRVQILGRPVDLEITLSLLKVC